MAKAQPPEQLGKPIVIGKQDLGEFIVANMRVYGVAVNTDRSVPDFYDGFKPVHRRLMFAAKTTARTITKTARLAGDTTGAFHPHGASTEGAIVTAVNMPTPPLYGHGNWGTLTAGAAAARYTNVRLSAYGLTFLETDYLAVTAHTPNYDDKEKEPVILPALLPNLLINGTSGIGVGVTTQVPAFTLESVLTVLIMLVKGKELDPNDYASRLILAGTYGGTPVRTKANFAKYRQIFESPVGSVKTEGLIDANYDKRQILCAKFPINFTGSDVESLVEGARAIEGVKSVSAGKGISRIVETDRRIEEEEFNAIARKVQALLTKSISYSIYVTDRIPFPADEVSGLCEYEVKFMRLSVPQLMEKWLERRLGLEVAVTQYRINRCKERIAYLELLMHAAEPGNIDIIANALKHKDSRERIAKGLKITLEQADVILGLRVAQLARLSIEDTAAECDKLRERVVVLEGHLKDPRVPVLEQLRGFKKDLHVRPRDPANWNCLQSWLSAT